jgi:hypothetical protein
MEKISTTIYLLSKGIRTRRTTRTKVITKDEN